MELADRSSVLVECLQYLLMNLDPLYLRNTLACFVVESNLGTEF